MRIEWKKFGVVQEAIRVVPASCANAGDTSAGLTVTVPPSVALACPSGAELTRRLFEQEPLGDLVKLTPGAKRWSPRRLLTIGAAGFTLVLGVVGLLFQKRRRRTRAAATEPDRQQLPRSPTAQ
jgi:hypothetical protein